MQGLNRDCCAFLKKKVFGVQMVPDVAGRLLTSPAKDLFINFINLLMRFLSW